MRTESPRDIPSVILYLLIITDKTQPKLSFHQKDGFQGIFLCQLTKKITEKLKAAPV